MGVPVKLRRAAEMPNGFNYRLLVVDNDPSILETSAAILRSKGYEVRTAKDGFAALAELRRGLPEVIISDLGMPNMSGFELLSIVRRRFPQIAVIALSADYKGSSPGGLIADAFFSKGDYAQEELFQNIAELLRKGPLRPSVVRPDTAPVWIPRNDEGYFVVTCQECLRSFSIPDKHSGSEVRETNCFFCDAKVFYLADLRTAKKPSRHAG
jgi:CheY-like chemotaxis protein